MLEIRGFSSLIFLPWHSVTLDAHLILCLTAETGKNRFGSVVVPSAICWENEMYLEIFQH